MCRYGLRLPQSERLIRKSARLLASSEDMKQLAKLGPEKMILSMHVTSAPGIPSVSAFAGAYSPEFVRAVLECVLSAFRDAPVVAIVEDSLPPDQWNEVSAVNKPSEAELQEVLKCLHEYIAHPPNSDLVRILKHGQASPEAIDAARCFECDFCKSQAKPGGPLPAQPHRVHEFKYQIGLDVKDLQGWLPNR